MTKRAKKRSSRSEKAAVTGGARRSRPRSSATPSNDSAAAAGGRARIRIYRHGLGDCILIRLHRRSGTDYKILIDCGVAVATRDASSKMIGVVKDVIHETDGAIDVLAVTHEHWDHVSGFAQAEDAFKGLAVGEVWVAWTEDTTDPLAKTLRKDHADAMALLQASANAMAAAGQDDRAQEIHNILGAAGDKTKAAFDKAKALGRDGPKIRYWQPDDKHQSPRQQIAPIHLDDPGVTIYALGPPYDPKLIRKTLDTKSDPETYKLKLDGAVFPAGAAKVLLATSEDVSPFAPTVSIPFDQARKMPFFKENYWASEADKKWRRVDVDWLGAASDLALAMQSATNNTSLVLAIEFGESDVLLFAGDAQVGNWLSWQDRTWNVNSRTVTGPDLLARTIFYKVGHHGSHNATLKEKGLEMMKSLRTAAIPVDQVVAKKMRWGAMPLTTLVTELGDRTGGRTLRTDIAPEGAMDGITVTDLFYEFEI
jgi:hypothetical protein